MIPPHLRLAQPWALLLLAAIPVAALLLLRAHRGAPRLRHPRASALAAAGPGLVARLALLPDLLVLAALALLAIALARPRAVESRLERRSVEGIDIVVALDLSTSMAAADFKPRNRLHVAKEVLKGFVARRPDDRIGLVVFARDAYTRCPLTLDHAALARLVDGLRFGLLEDRTAIGNALATAVNRLRESDARSKVIILVTDGDNNAGQISPREAADLARTFGIRVFPILVGKGGVVPYPVGVGHLGEPVYEDRAFPVNPALLDEIARTTGGTSAVATDREALERGLEAVLDRMERTRLASADVRARPVELFPRLLGPAFWLAAVGLVLAATRWRTFP